jgi:uroporphyrinogen-III synthase
MTKKTILITRPLSQGEVLSALLRKQGFQVHHIPVMEIEPLSLPEQLAPIEKIFSRITSYHGIIFVSVNAAEQALPWLKKYPHARTTKILSVGKSTADFYNANHVHDSKVIYPRQHMNSEGLLALNELQADEVQGRRYLILRGSGGREVIAQGLKERGAHVDSCELYRRYLPEKNISNLKKVLPATDLIVVSSGESLENLATMAGELSPDLLLEKTILVPGERVATIAHQLKFRHIMKALNATDAAVIEAVNQWM